MPRYCNICRLTFGTERAYRDHMLEVHRYPRPPRPLLRKLLHPSLTARKCDINGQFLPAGAPPPPPDDVQDWWPFLNRPHFGFAHWHFQRVQTSEGNLNEVLRNYAAEKALETGNIHATAPFESAREMLDTIDAIPHGEAAWTTFDIKYTGPVTPHTPAWKRKTYTIYTRNSLRVVENMAASVEFDGRWDYAPYEEYSAEGCRRYSNVMSGTWAFKKAVF